MICIICPLGASSVVLLRITNALSPLHFSFIGLVILCLGRRLSKTIKRCLFRFRVIARGIRQLVMNYAVPKKSLLQFAALLTGQGCSSLHCGNRWVPEGADCENMRTCTQALCGTVGKCENCSQVHPCAAPPLRADRLLKNTMRRAREESWAYDLAV